MTYNQQAVIILLITFLLSCSPARHSASVKISLIAIDTLMNRPVSIRAVAVDGSRVWYSGTDGQYGFTDMISGASVHRQTDSLADFRSIAQTDKDIFILNAGAPARLFRISKADFSVSLVYSEENENVFYDSMHFADNLTGFAMGDPTDRCLSVLKTIDGGMTWKKLPCNLLGNAEDGEAAFAASNSTLVTKGRYLRMVSGGKRARLWRSDDSGLSWQVFETPIVQGRPMTGIFSSAFFDADHGVIAGGDYENLAANTGNKAITSDGGRTWALLAEGHGPGYISSIQYLSRKSDNYLITAGATGIHYSTDQGKNWERLSTIEKVFTILPINDSTVIAGGRNMILKLSLKVD